MVGSFLGSPFPLAVIPPAALFPILLFIGLVIGAQAFQTSVGRHAPAIVLALMPNIGQWAQTYVDGALGAAGVQAHDILPALANNGVLYTGLETLGAGAVLAGLMLGAIAVFIIDKHYARAIVYCVLAAGLAAVGLIHDPLGLIFNFSGVGDFVRAPSPVYLGYVFAAVVIWVVAMKEGGASGSDLMNAITTPPTEEERAA